MRRRVSARTPVRRPVPAAQTLPASARVHLQASPVPPPKVTFGDRVEEAVTMRPPLPMFRVAVASATVARVMLAPILRA